MRMRHSPLIESFRLVELLSVGVSANVFSAVATRPGEWGQAGEGAIVKVREGDGGTGERAILREHPIPHMPRLLHHAAQPGGGEIIVMTACEGVPVGESGSALGDAANRVAPLVAELHAAGWAHGSLDGAAVLRAADGSVSLVSFRRAVRSSSPRFARAAARDLAALAPPGAGPGSAPGSSLGDARGGRRAAQSDESADDGSHEAADDRDDEVADEEWSAYLPRRVEEVADAPRIAEAVDPALEALRVAWESIRYGVGLRRRRWLTLQRRRLLLMTAGVTGVVVVVVSALLP
jgi:hypothetical protein